ncbi:MAG: putative MPP superfamily phosphohydrolase [Myxococcota bacterium]|jgi:predicted MPP superfamily phosphohydrolase
MLHADGRGKNYSPARGLIEAVLKVAYFRGWPGRLWGALPGRSVVHPQHLDLRILPPGTPPLRLAFLSDLHIGPTTPPALLDAAFACVTDWAPDILALGGDYVFLEASEAVAAELSRRVAAVPAAVKVAVMGNHDLWTFHHRLEDALTRAGATVLTNDALRLPAPHADVALLGIDDPWTGSPDAETAVTACGDASVRIALSHSPDGVPLLSESRADLILCGHTHGGQIALPGGVPLVVPGPMGKVWPWGLHRLADGWLFVSRGLGGVEIPMRSFAPPDVALITLRACEAG